MLATERDRPKGRKKTGRKGKPAQVSVRAPVRDMGAATLRPFCPIPRVKRDDREYFIREANGREEIVALELRSAREGNARTARVINHPLWRMRASLEPWQFEAADQFRRDFEVAYSSGGHSTSVLVRVDGGKGAHGMDPAPYAALCRINEIQRRVGFSSYQCLKYVCGKGWSVAAWARHMRDLPSQTNKMNRERALGILAAALDGAAAYYGLAPRGRAEITGWEGPE